VIVQMSTVLMASWVEGEKKSPEKPGDAKVREKQAKGLKRNRLRLVRTDKKNRRNRKIAKKIALWGEGACQEKIQQVRQKRKVGSSKQHERIKRQKELARLAQAKRRIEKRGNLGQRVPSASRVPVAWGGESLGRNLKEIECSGMGKGITLLF